MRTISFMIFITIFFQSVGSANNYAIQTFNQDYSDSAKTFDQFQIDKYFQILRFNQESFKSWIAQKEIAAWGAVVLFLSIIFVLINNFDALKQRPVISSIFILLFSLMFCLFIHQQYGSMVYSVAAQRAINKATYSTIINGKLPEYIDITDEYKLAASLESLIQSEQKDLRSYGWYLKPFLPFIKIFIDRDILTVEVEESILYDIILLVNIFMIIGIYQAHPTMDVKKADEERKKAR